MCNPNWQQFELGGAIEKENGKTQRCKVNENQVLGGRIWPARRLLANYEGFEAPRSGP